MKKRLTREEAAETNRAAVLASARRQFEERGFYGATLDSIAEAAGFSKGVVYSRFGSKDDLFLALLEENIERRHRDTAERFRKLKGPEGIPRLAELSIGDNAATLSWQVALLEFRAHAWRHPELNERYRRLHRRTIESIAGFMAELYRRSGEEPPDPVAFMAMAGLAAGTGVVTELMADPALDVPRIATRFATGIGPVAAPKAGNGEP